MMGNETLFYLSFGMKHSHKYQIMAESIITSGMQCFLQIFNQSQLIWHPAKPLWDCQNSLYLFIIWVCAYYNLTILIIYCQINMSNVIKTLIDIKTLLLSMSKIVKTSHVYWVVLVHKY